MIGSFVLVPCIALFLIYKEKFDTGSIALVLTASISIDELTVWLLESLGECDGYFVSFERCLKFTKVI